MKRLLFCAMFLFGFVGFGSNLYAQDMTGVPVRAQRVTKPAEKPAVSSRATLPPYEGDDSVEVSQDETADADMVEVQARKLDSTCKGTIRINKKLVSDPSIVGSLWYNYITVRITNFDQTASQSIHDALRGVVAEPLCPGGSVTLTFRRGGISNRQYFFQLMAQSSTGERIEFSPVYCYLGIPRNISFFSYDSRYTSCYESRTKEAFWVIGGNTARTGSFFGNQGTQISGGYAGGGVYSTNAPNLDLVIPDLGGQLRDIIARGEERNYRMELERQQHAQEQQQFRQRYQEQEILNEQRLRDLKNGKGQVGSGRSQSNE